MKRIRKKSNNIFLALCLVVLAALSPSYSFAQEVIKVSDQNWDADFRDHLTFSLRAESTAGIVEVSLFYQVVGQIATSRNEAVFTPGTSVDAEFVIDQTDPSNYSPPGTEFQYWWKIVDAAGNELKTEKETLLYLDDRYNWKTLENERLVLYWYEGDDSFGQSLFERANVALDTLESDVGIALEEPIKIFIYGGHNDLLGALRTSAQEWTGGVAFTEFGTVLIGIHPQQLDWGLNAMTHEMTHLVIHQATQNPFGDLPRWLDEGIAVYNENRDELDDDFRSLFERAVANNELMTLRTLSSPFPGDPLKANLAYGQSGAVVKYIIDTHGSEAMAELLDIFAEGALYDDALEQALGVDMDRLDNEFRASVGLSPLPGTENSSTEEVDEAFSAEVAVDQAEAAEENVTEAEALPQVVEEAVGSAESVEEPIATAPTAKSVSVVEGASAEEASSQDTQSDGSPLSLSCLAGAFSLLALGLVITKRRGAL